MSLNFYKSEMSSYNTDIKEGVRTAGHGMEWNGTEISVWNMEDARMEWNGRFQEWNGRQFSILYFHTNSILDFMHCIYRKIHTDVG